MKSFQGNYVKSSLKICEIWPSYQKRWFGQYASDIFFLLLFTFILYAINHNGHYAGENIIAVSQKMQSM